MDRKEALEKLLIMQCKYRHIRKKDDEWEAIETALQALQEKEHRCENCGNAENVGVHIYCLLHTSFHRLDEYCSEWEAEEE